MLCEYTISNRPKYKQPKFIYDGGFVDFVWANFGDFIPQLGIKAQNDLYVIYIDWKLRLYAFKLNCDWIWSHSI